MMNRICLFHLQGGIDYSVIPDNMIHNRPHSLIVPQRQTCLLLRFPKSRQNLGHRKYDAPKIHIVVFIVGAIRMTGAKSKKNDTISEAFIGSLK